MLLGKLPRPWAMGKLLTEIALDRVGRVESRHCPSQTSKQQGTATLPWSPCTLRLHTYDDVQTGHPYECLEEPNNFAEPVSTCHNLASEYWLQCF